MLTAEWCAIRRKRFLEQFGNEKSFQWICISHPLHLNYLSNFFVDPISLNAGYSGLLMLREDGFSRIYHDDRLKSSANHAFADECVSIPWYDGKSPGKGSRLSVFDNLIRSNPDFFNHSDLLTNISSPTINKILTNQRRQKDIDETLIIRNCIAATEAGHAWASENVRPGMTELDVYSGIASACNKQAGQAVIVYGDFAVSPGPNRRGGPATNKTLKLGDMLILDFSVVIHGYRSDFTNTIVVGKIPSSDQKKLFDLCWNAMKEGEKKLKSGTDCLSVYQAVKGVFEKAGVGDYFPHHAGHGLGLGHPEAPFFVIQANESLLENDVVTLEPGLYIEGIGGIRIENNYLIQKESFETLTHHIISLI